MYIRNPATTFCIVLRLKCGASYQTTIYGARKEALGRAFGEVDGEGDGVLFCKAVGDLTEDERWQWGVQTSSDEARFHRSYDRMPMNQLDMH